MGIPYAGHLQDSRVEAMDRRAWSQLLEVMRKLLAALEYWELLPLPLGPYTASSRALAAQVEPVYASRAPVQCL